MKLTVLIDNSPGAEGLTSEHGLSLYIEANGKNVLFDTGATGAFAPNAVKLGVDLGKVDLAVLSHGHFDHGGGLGAFFFANDAAPLFLRSTADGEHYAKVFLRKRYIGLDRKLLETNKDRLRWLSNDTEVAPGLHVMTNIPRTEKAPDTRKRLLVRKGGSYVPDEFSHELFLVVIEDDGMTVITGCGHRGVLNMVVAAKVRFPDAPVKAVIGGFHLMKLMGGMAWKEDEVKAMARRFRELGCEKVICGHCTGPPASDLLKREMGEAFIGLRTGLRSSL